MMSLRVRWKHSRNQPTKFLSSKEKKVRRDCKACWNRSHSKMWEEELTRSRRTWGSGLLFLPPPATQRTLCSHQRARPQAGLSGRPGIPATARCRGPRPPLGTHKADDATRTQAAHRVLPTLPGRSPTPRVRGCHWQVFNLSLSSQWDTARTQRLTLNSCSNVNSFFYDSHVSNSNFWFS